MLKRSAIQVLAIFALILALCAPGAFAAQQTDDGVMATITPSSCKYEGEVELNISAPGAKQIQLYYNGRRDMRIDGDTYKETWVIYEDVEIFAYAEFEDGWSGPSAPARVDCTSTGNLSPIELTVPSSVKEGEDVTVFWTALDNLVRYTLNVFRVEGNEKTYVYTAWQDADATSCELPSLTAGEYLVIVEAWDEDGKSSAAQKTLNVAKQTVPAAPTVTVDRNSVLIGETVDFTITAPGAEKVRTQFGRNIGYDWEDRTDGDEIGLSFSFTEGGLFNAAFSVLVDGVWSPYSEPIAITVIQYGMLDNPHITLPEAITAGEDLVVNWNAVENAESYWVTLYIVDKDGNEQFVEGVSAVNTSCIFPGRAVAEGDCVIYVSAEKTGYRSGNGYVYFTVDAADTDYLYRISGGKAIITGYVGGDSVVTIPDTIDDYPVAAIGEDAFSGRMVTEVILPDTLELIDAHAFNFCTLLERITVPRNTHAHKYAFYNCGSLTVYGYTNSAAQYAAEYAGCAFISTGTPAAAPTVAAEKTNLLIEEDTVLTVTAPGATMLRIRNSNYWDEEEYESDGDEAIVEVDFYDPGRYTVSVSALLDGNWTQYSEPITFTVTSLGKLGNPTMTLPEEIAAGQDLTITFTSVENAEEYCLVYSAYGSDGYYNYITQEDADAPTASMTIAGRYIQGGEGQLTLYARAEGWEESSASVYFDAEESEYDFAYEILDGGVMITGYIGSNMDVVVPDEIEDMPVVCIGEDAFAERNITSIILPSSLERIERWAFGYCEQLRSIEIGPDVWVDLNAFYGCYDLIVRGYTGSDAQAAAENCGCTFIALDNLPDGSLSIALSAAKTAAAPGKTIRLTKAITPSGMEDTYTFTFASSDTQIATVSQAGVVTMIKPGFVTITLIANDPLATSTSILLECEGDNVYVMPDELDQLGDEALSGTPVQAVVLSEEITSIGAYALADCESLYKVVIPAASCSIDETAFDGSEGAAIVAPQGSDAQAYAEEYGLTFYPLED